jgi:molybdopterin-guanine dinucleotide biosynthesis protein B
MHELRGASELSLDAALARLSPCDLVLVEGFKTAPIPKLEVYRASVGKPILHSGDRNIVAVATDGPLSTQLPVFELKDVTAIAAFITGYAGPPGRPPGAATAPSRPGL